MKRLILVVALLSLMLISTAMPAAAEGLTMTGTISAGNLLPNGRLNDSSLTCSSLETGTFYYDLFEITPTTSGTYYYADVGYLSDDPAYIDGWFAIYTGPAGSFDPADPAGNGCFANFDDQGVVNLTAGVTYTVMASNYVSGETGTYLFYLNTETYFSGTLAAGTTITGGRWDDSGLGCSILNGDPDHYFVTFTYTPDVSAYYLYLDGREEYGTIDVWLAIFDGPFDPANPLDNCIANFDDDGGISLTAGVTYTLVMTNYDTGVTGQGSFLLLGPGGGGTVVQHCPYPLPSGSVVYSVPAGAPTFWAPDLATQTDLILPAGTWWISEFDGDFAKVWIACQAQPIWIPTNAVAR